MQPAKLLALALLFSAPVAFAAEPLSAQDLHAAVAQFLPLRGNAGRKASEQLAKVVAAESPHQAAMVGWAGPAELAAQDVARAFADKLRRAALARGSALHLEHETIDAEGFHGELRLFGSSLVFRITDPRGMEREYTATTRGNEPPRLTARIVSAKNGADRIQLRLAGRGMTVRRESASAHGMRVAEREFTDGRLTFSRVTYEPGAGQAGLKKGWSFGPAGAMRRVGDVVRDATLPGVRKDGVRVRATRR